MTRQRSIFVTGTDTGTGKTVVSGALCLKLNWPYWKPIQSGAPSDSEWISERIAPLKTHIEAYNLSQPLSPHLSAKLDNQRIELRAVLEKVPRIPHVIEGAGGLLVPLNETTLMVDLIRALPAQVIIVARSTLGTINHTLLTLEAARRRELCIMGVILVGDQNPENRRAIEFYGKVPVIGEIPTFSKLDRDDLIKIGQRISLEGIN